MRIMFKRHVKFPLRDGTFTKTYEPDEEHTIPDDIAEQIQETSQYKQLSNSKKLVVIKDTAPTKADVEKRQKAAEAEAAKNEAAAAEKSRKDAEAAERKRTEDESKRQAAEEAKKAAEAEAAKKKAAKKAKE